MELMREVTQLRAQIEAVSGGLQPWKGEAWKNVKLCETDKAEVIWKLIKCETGKNGNLEFCWGMGLTICKRAW